MSANGLPFWDYPSLIDHLAWNSIHDGDNLVAIDGQERSGKSTLARRIVNDLSDHTRKVLAHLAEKDARRQTDLDNYPDFVPQRDIILNYEDWVESFDINRRYARYILDEASNIAFSRDFSRGETKEITKMSMQWGQLNSTVLMIIPNLHWLDSYFRDHRVQIRCHVWRQGYKRGFATAQWRRENWRNGDSWWEDAIEELRFDDLIQDAGYLRKKTKALGITGEAAIAAAKDRVKKNKKNGTKA